MQEVLYVQWEVIVERRVVNRVERKVEMRVEWRMEQWVETEEGSWYLGQNWTKLSNFLEVRS